MMQLLDITLWLITIGGLFFGVIYAHRHEWQKEEEVNYNIDVWED